jgi:F0F1-type ATP synthase membrane subunit b/b'
MCHHIKPSYPAKTKPRYPNESENKEKELKSNLTKMIEAFKEDINKSLKEIQENTFKQVETLKEEGNKYSKCTGKENQIGEECK